MNIEFISEFLGTLPVGSCSECAVKLSFMGFEFEKYFTDMTDNKD